MSRIEIYAKSWCPYCARARALLEARGLAYEIIDVTTDATRELAMRTRAGRRTVPQIFIDDRHVGGYDELAALDAVGGLPARTLPVQPEPRVTTAVPDA
jgi:glutaredoxin 3